MNGILQLTIEGFSEFQDHGKKEDGSPDIRTNSGYKISIVSDRQRLLFEETLQRNALPSDPTVCLSDRIAKIMAPYLPKIDPKWPT